MQALHPRLGGCSLCMSGQGRVSPPHIPLRRCFCRGYGYTCFGSGGQGACQEGLCTHRQVQSTRLVLHGTTVVLVGSAPLSVAAAGGTRLFETDTADLVPVVHGCIVPLCGDVGWVVIWSGSKPCSSSSGRRCSSPDVWRRKGAELGWG